MISLAAGALSSCGLGLPPAVGGGGEIGLISRFAPDDPRIALLERLLERQVETVRGEEAFRIEPVGIDARRSWKSHLVLVDLRRPLDRRLTRSLLEESDQEAWARRPATHRFFRNVWARGQVVLLLHAQDPESLRRYLDDRGEEIFARFDDLLVGALTEALLAGGEEERLEKLLAAEHPFRLRIPIGYMLEGRKGIVQVKRVVPEEPKRWLLVHYGAALEAPRRPEDWLALRDSVVATWRTGDRVLADRSSAEEGLFQGRACVRLEGIWQNETYAMGGPFRGYGFVRGEHYFLIDLTVFHPPAPKLPALRQLMAIARTFEG